MEGLEVDLFVGDQDVAVDVVEGQDLPGEDVVLLEEGLLGDALDLAHVEGLLVELVDDHAVYAVLEQVVVLLLAALVQEDQPLLQVLHVLVGRVDSCVDRGVLICSERSSKILKGSGGELPRLLMVVTRERVKLMESLAGWRGGY